MANKRHRAALVVLADIGRSPRMQYHAISLASQAGMEVDVVAYSGSEPNSAFVQHPNIHLHEMKTPLCHGLPRIVYLMALPLKMAIQLTTLFWILCHKIPTPDFFLLQNPPSIPTFTVVIWACWLRQAAFIIDWHNFGHTILSMSLGRSHPLVRIYSWYERRYGKMANAHLCVTKAMQLELEKNWEIKATVLYDRSPSYFHSTSIKEKHELFCRLNLCMLKPLHICSEGRYLACQNSVPDSNDTGDGQIQHTLFTSSFLIRSPNQIETDDIREFSLRKDRPALIISSTSWTIDEDFSMLLEAAVCYDRRVSAILGDVDSFLGTDGHAQASTCIFPHLLIIVTGKGPMREEYELRIQKLRLQRVTFRTMWVSAKDYPLLLGSADLGVCLHTSSSGLDLPMKVVDMFGCGLPVCAVSYSCIDELVKNGENGLLFWSSSELANQLMDLFKGFPHNCDALKRLQNGALASGSSCHWADEWAKYVLPLLSECT